MIDLISLLPLIGAILILIYFIIFNKNLLRIEWNCVSSFIAFMVLVSCGRIAYNQYFYDPSIVQNFQTYGNDSWHLFLVFWEDLFFGGSVFLICKFINCKWIKIPLIILVSLWFASGHVYQGYFAAALIGVYPFFISYKYGMKYGFGTIMACHILYDFFSVYMTKFMPYFL
jgi:hypothetical protein